MRTGSFLTKLGEVQVCNGEAEEQNSSGVLAGLASCGALCSVASL